MDGTNTAKRDTAPNAAARNAEDPDRDRYADRTRNRRVRPGAQTGKEPSGQSAGMRPVCCILLRNPVPYGRHAVEHNRCAAVCGGIRPVRCGLRLICFGKRPPALFRRAFPRVKKPIPKPLPIRNLCPTPFAEPGSQCPLPRDGREYSLTRRGGARPARRHILAARNFAVC